MCVEKGHILDCTQSSTLLAAIAVVGVIGMFFRRKNASVSTCVDNSGFQAVFVFCFVVWVEETHVKLGRRTSNSGAERKAECADHSTKRKGGQTTTSANDIHTTIPILLHAEKDKFFLSHERHW